MRNRTEVEHAGFAYAGILLGLQDTVGVFIPPGRTSEEMNAEQEKPRLKSLSPGYLQTMGVPLFSGRYLDERDRAGASGSSSIGRSRRYFGDANAVGQTMVWRTGPGMPQRYSPSMRPSRLSASSRTSGRAASPVRPMRKSSWTIGKCAPSTNE